MRKARFTYDGEAVDPDFDEFDISDVLRAASSGGFAPADCCHLTPVIEPAPVKELSAAEREKIRQEDRLEVAQYAARGVVYARPAPPPPPRPISSPPVYDQPPRWTPPPIPRFRPAKDGRLFPYHDISAQAGLIRGHKSAYRRNLRMLKRWRNGEFKLVGWPLDEMVLPLYAAARAITRRGILLGEPNK